MTPTIDATIQMIPASQIVPGANDRRQFAPERVYQLATSIQVNGMAQPITVRPRAQGTFEIVCGERRFRALSQILQREAIPCLVRNLTDEEAASVMLLENTARQDLNVIEEAIAHPRFYQQLGLDLVALRQAGIDAIQQKYLR